MKITLECTDPTQEFIIDLYKTGVRISDARMSCNNWLDLTLEGSELNLLKVYAKHWCEPGMSDLINDFNQYKEEHERK